ncbi:MAG: CPBP family intramembrane metalloprotease [Caldilineales bacterium]|nr:CPBP family intramembrane metalloprotease [Caldilineales bacterium]
MRFDDPVALAYAGIYAAALLLAVWKRRTFPLQDAITVTLVVGFGFTALVYVLAPAYPGAPAVAGASPAEMLFTLLYLGLIAGLLVVAKPLPRVWKGHFVKERLGVGLYKLLIFVLLPLAGLRLFWQTSWANLGFALGDLRGQLLAALLLALLLGGFNLLVGSGAAPIRSRQFSARQVSLGFGLAFLWNLLEVGLVEEFFFRGFLQGRLTGFLGAPVGGICAASLLFGLAHAPGIYLRRGEEQGALGPRPTLLNAVLYSILALSPTGWFMGLLYWRTQSLLAPILVHAAVDAVAHIPTFIRGVRLR